MLREIDRAEAAVFVWSQPLFAARVRRFQLVQMRHRVLAVRRVEEQHARLAVVMRVLDDFVEQFARADGAPHFAVARVDEFEVVVVLDRAHKCVGDADRDVEIADVPFDGLAAHEIENVRMIDAEHRHVRAAARPALRDLSERGVVDAQETDRAGRDARARDHVIAARAQTRKRKTVAAAGLLDQRRRAQRRKNAARVASHIVGDRQNETRRELPSGVPAPVNVGELGKKRSSVRRE